MHAPNHDAKPADPGKAPNRPAVRSTGRDGKSIGATPRNAPTGRETPLPAIPAPAVVNGNAIPAGCVPIWAPAGVCPVKLTGIGENDVLAWARTLRETFLVRREWLSANALAYFARTILDWDTKEYRAVAAILTTHFGEES